MKAIKVKASDPRGIKPPENGVFCNSNKDKCIWISSVNCEAGWHVWNLYPITREQVIWALAKDIGSHQR